MDLTEKRYSIFTEAIQLVNNNEAVKFVMADINCRLQVAFRDGSSLVFSDCDNLHDILNKKGIDYKQPFAGVLKNGFSLEFWNTRGGGGGAPVLASLFNKVARLRACKYITERLWCVCVFL